MFRVLGQALWVQGQQNAGSAGACIGIEQWTSMHVLHGGLKRQQTQTHNTQSSSELNLRGGIAQHDWMPGPVELVAAGTLNA